MNDITLKEAARLFVGKKKIRLLCHIRPDGDALGSAFGLKYALTASGKHTVEVCCEDTVPKRLLFLTEGRESLAPSVDADLICSVDCSETHRIGEGFDGRVELKLDHHKDGSPFAERNYTDAAASATGEIIFALINELSETGDAILTKEAATSLYAAISSDTGSFKYSNVTSDTLRIAASLVDAGASPAEVAYRLYGIKTLDETAAERIMLSGFELYLDGRIAFLLITDEMKGSLPDDCFGEAASRLREIEGVELSVTVRADVADKEKYKISMRSGETVSASELCKLFGGGGHERAAGASVRAKSPEEAKRTVLDAVISALK